MARIPSAKRYALALYQLAKEKSLVDEWHAQLGFCEEVFKDEDFFNFLSMPKIELSRKMDVVKSGVGGLDQMVYNLIGMLIARDMVRVVPSIKDEYGRLMDEENGLERAYVRSAVPLSETHQKDLNERLSNLTGKKIQLITEIDSSVVAGFIARIGDRMIDGSAKTKLQNLRKSLIEVSVDGDSSNSI